MDKRTGTNKKTTVKQKTMPKVKTDIDFNIKSSRLKGVLSIILVVIVLVFSVHQVYVLFNNEDTSGIQTQTARLQTIYRNINTRGFVVRQEHIIPGSVSGTVVPEIENGSKVSVGDTVARVYKSEQSAKISADIKTLKSEIEYYENISSTLSGSLLADIDLYESNVQNSLLKVMDCISQGNLKELSALSQELRLDITKKQIAVGGNIDVSEKLKELYAEYNSLALSDSAYSAITVSESGFFVNETDGLEDAADYDNVTSFMYDDVEQLLSKEPSYNSDSLGRIITEFSWFLVCNIPNSETDGLKVASSYKINFSESNGDDIKMKVVAMNSNANGYTTVIFESNEMSNDIATLRISDIKIRAEEYSGYAVSINAVRTVTQEIDGVETDVVGVYVKLGSIVRFKKIDIVYSDDSIILAYSKAGESGYIARYDEVITEGTDLYDGKIIT